MYSILITLLLVNAPAAAEVSATRLDSSAIAGVLQSWDDKQAVLVTADGEQAVGIDELLSLRWAPAPPTQGAAAMATSAHVELVDGSLIPIKSFQSTAAEVSIELDQPMSADGNTLTLPKRQLASVRLHALEATAAEQWQEIRDLRPAADVLVLLKRGGKSLDYVEGVLGDVSSDKIEFKLDDEPVRIDREKVAGFIFYRKDESTKVEPRCVIHSRSGLRATVARARVTDGNVQLTTAAGAELNWPLEDIYLADFSAGKLIYLSDMEPVSERWTPLVALPTGATLAAEYGAARRDQSAYGGPLTLSPTDDISNSQAFRTRSFNKGLALRSRTELAYRLPAGFRRLNAIAGIDPATSASGNVRLEIYGDDRPLLEADIAGHEPPRMIDLDIAGVKRLKVVVDYGQNLDTGDWLNLCDARIVK